MTLEDFFTLTEIKDGLTVPSRVEELVSVMQRDKDSIVKNVGDASRQWAAVASTIAATKNRDCLNVFMQLDGLHYIDRWLRDAQQLSNDSADSIIEESVFALLRALENLCVGSQKSIYSGIWLTVKNLTCHNSCRVQDIAKALFDGWKRDKVSEYPLHDKESISRSQEHEVSVQTVLTGESSKPEVSAVDLPLSKPKDNEQIQGGEIREAESLPVTNSEETKFDRVQDLEHQKDETGLSANMILDHSNTEDRTLDNSKPSCSMANAVQENASLKEKCSMEETAPTETGVEGPSDAPLSGQFPRDEKQVVNLQKSAERPGVSEGLASCSVGHLVISSDAIVASNEEIRTEVLRKSVDSTEVSRLSSEPKSGLEDVGFANNCRNQVIPLTRQDSKYESDTSPDSSGKHHRHGKPENFGTSFYADIATTKDGKGYSSSRNLSWRKSSHFSRSATASRGLRVLDTRTTDIELEYGIVDALEVATKVAQEVAREVSDSREPSCNSSEKLSGENTQPASPDSTNEKQNLFTESPLEEAATSENHSTETSHEGQDQDHVNSSNNLENNPEYGITNDGQSSQVTETVQQPEVSAEKGLRDFDLNQEFCSDDTDHAASSISTPIPVVSASRPSGLPSTPLQFEGNLGWKGSAATSAFRPASPRKLFVGPIGNNSSKQKQGFLGIDLNVADGIDDKVEDLTSGKQIPISSNLKSAESSVEVNPGKADRFNLDLNCTNDDGDAHPPSDLKMETRFFLSRNSHQSASPASSSSSAQPLVRNINIDLNDRPQFHIDSSDQGHYYGRSSWSTNTYTGHSNESEEPVISILGKKVEVGRKDFLPQASSFLHNGKSLEPTMDLNMGRTGNAFGLAPTMSYTHPPIYDYSGLTTTPGMSFSSPMYVPGTSIPYMMDSRGPLAMPQVIGSVPPVHSAYHPSPFIMNMVGGPSGLNGAGPIRPGFDLNSGFGVEGGNRNPMGLRQFLLPGQGRQTEEHLRTNSQQSSSSMVSGKRKEPESGWEPFTLDSRPQPPPWR